MTQRYGYLVNRFDGGLNTKVAFYVGAPNESPDLQNVDFDDLGAVETRKGLKLFDTLATAPADLLMAYRSDTTSQLLAVNQGTLYVSPNGNSFITAPEGASIFNPGSQVYGHVTQNHAWISDGYTNYKWDGASVTKWGMSTPPRMPVPSQYGDDTGYSGAVTYVQTYQDTFLTETLASQPRNVDASCNLQFTLSALSDVQGVKYLNVYRKKDAEESQYRLLTSLVNTGGQFTVRDELDDLTFASTYSVAVDPAPKKWTTYTDHIGYMFAAGSESPTYLYYSYINNPTRWSAGRLIRIGDGDGYPIRALATYAGHLIIAKDDGAGNGSVWLLYTPDAEPTNWSLSRIDTPYGAIGQKSIVKFSNYLSYLNSRGVYHLSEQTVGSTTTTAVSYNIEPDVYKWVRGFLEQSRAINHRNKVYFAVPYQSNRNNRVYVYDYVHGRDEQTGQYGTWSRYDWAASEMAVHEDKLYVAGYDGKIYTADHVYYNDSSSAIDSYFETMSLHGVPEHRDNMKVWRYAWLTVATVGNWTMLVEWAEDFGNVGGTSGSSTLNLGSGGVLWGDATWGSSSWDPGTARARYRVNLGGYISKSIQFRFSTDTADQRWKVYDMLLEYNLRGIRQR